MDSYIDNIWIEAENWIEGQWNYDNDNTNVIVTLNNGEKFVATFFTYSNIEHLRKKNQLTGELMSGKYFQASDMILIDKCSREDIEMVIKYMVLNNELESFFTKI